MSSESKSLKDAGAVLPYAKKHSAHQGFSSGKGEVTLKQLWPEPDWNEFIENGVEPLAAAHLFLIYKNLRKKPREYSYSTAVSNDEWFLGYVKGISVLKGFFSEVRTCEDARNINNRFAQSLGCDSSAAIAKEDPAEFSLYWSLGYGEKNLRPPASLKEMHRRLLPYMVELGWPGHTTALRVEQFPMELHGGRWVSCQVKGKGLIQASKEDFESEEDCLDYINELIKKERALRETAKIPTKPSCINIKRKGPANRTENVSGKNICKDFDVRGVQFGSTYSNSEKQIWANSIYDSLEDLARIIGFKKKWIGLKGIGVAFGARGYGSALAHYEPDLRVINLTRKKGASSLGHEWWHAFDHSLNNLFDYPYKYASVATKWSASAKSENLEPAVESLRNLYNAICVESQNYLEVSSNINGRKGSGSYWTKTEELFARAFETYLQDKLIRNGEASPWLVHGTRPEDYQVFDPKNHPYPSGSELEAISEAFDAFFEEIVSP
jgi:hypothetical protein